MTDVTVRVGRKDYRIPYAEFGRLAMITNNPSNRRGILVWRLKKTPNNIELALRRGYLRGGEIREQRKESAIAYASLWGEGKEKTADVWHYLVSKNLRGKTVGAAMRELLLREFVDMGVESVIFPYHKEKGFYEKRGLEPLNRSPFRGIELMRYGGKISELGVKPGAVKLKVMWKKSMPRFAK